MMKTVFKNANHCLVALGLLTLLPLLQFGQRMSYEITDQTYTARKLAIRPNFVLGISYFDKDFYVGTNVDAQYWHAKTFDARIGVTGGTFTGISLGATYHLHDDYESKSHKFVVSQSQSGNTTTTKYFNGSANVRSIMGPCVDLRFGKMGAQQETAPFFFELNAGLDFQRFCRVYADVKDDSYPSNKNGWFDVKAYLIYAHSASRNGVGLAGTMLAARRPWKGVTMYLSCQLGVLKTFKAGTQPLIGPGFGLSINLFEMGN